MLFTPIDASTGLRIKLEIEETFIPRGGAWESENAFEVRAARTGLAYRIIAKECNFPGCRCDAVILGYDGPLVLADNF